MYNIYKHRREKEEEELNSEEAELSTLFNSPETAVKPKAQRSIQRAVVAQESVLAKQRA